ncbi:DegT/DnrJ/EryC1/StrS family aminotransferase [Lacimonas salitolerans]|uniref:DegT/DnrJ/EryC1/StrS family aminotransferase n=1 Tax=Lacimonas salitolerans TaxID=1323750 RepID=A0ABW4EHN0_9RHOB
MPRLGLREWFAVGRVIAHGDLLRTSSSLRLCQKFERGLARRLGARHTLAVNNGTAALITALQACRIGPGDEVLVSAYTWMASAAAVLHVGAVPVLVEIDQTLTMDIDDLAAKITPRARAIIPVHMNNRPCDMDRLLDIAAKHDLRVIEDACQAIGVRYKGRACGTIGDAGTFSFNQMKNMTCGEGGAVLTSDDLIYERAYCAHDMGVNFRKFAPHRTDQEFVGGNFRISEIEGAILNVQLSKLPGRMRAMRRRVAAMEPILKKAGLPIAPHNNPGEACSIVVTFDTEAEAIEFAENIGVRRLFDNSKHVFTKWTAILDGRMAHPRFDPWAWAEDVSPPSADECPRTLDLLSRSCAISPILQLPHPAAIVLAHRLAKRVPERKS